MVANIKTGGLGKTRTLLRWCIQRRLTLTFLLLGAIIFLFIFVPLAKMIFSNSPSTLWDTLLQKQVRDALWLSIYTSLITTAVGILLGVPLAYILARHNFPGKKIVESIIDIPIVVPHIAAGIALLFVFGKNFIGGQIFGVIGVDFVYAVPGIIIAMLFVSVPFLINSAKQGFQEVDVRLENVARTLGASPWQTFFRISLPLARRSIFGGSVMMWARGISEFGAVLVLTSHPTVSTILVNNWLEMYGLKAALPVAAVLTLICIIIFVILRTIAYWGKRG